MRKNIKIRDVLVASQGLNDIQTTKIKASVGFKIVRVKKQLDDLLETFEEQRKVLIQKYGKKDEKGELVNENDTVQIEDREKFNTEYKELLEEEVAIDTTISEDDINEIEVTLATLSAIEPLLGSITTMSDE